jgi:HEPN domain-containing protein
MRGDPCNPEVWFQVARRDIKAYGTLMASGDFHLATFCLQQASEKALKGWLIGRGWHLIKTHTLTLLQTEAQLHGLDLEWFTPSAERLTDLYFTDRYVDIAPDPEPTEEEIRAMAADVEKLLGILKNNPNP